MLGAAAALEPTPKSTPQAIWRIPCPFKGVSGRWTPQAKKSLLSFLQKKKIAEEKKRKEKAAGKKEMRAAAGSEKKRMRCSGGGWYGVVTIYLPSLLLLRVRLGFLK